MPTVYERVKQIAVDKLAVDEAQVVPDASFTEDLSADSLDLVELVMAMEEEFSQEDNKIEIPDEEAEKILTVQNAVDYLKEHGVKDT